jgi:hypothetical protein
VIGVVIAAYAIKLLLLYVINIYSAVKFSFVSSNKIDLIFISILSLCLYRLQMNNNDGIKDSNTSFKVLNILNKLKYVLFSFVTISK